jgi:hypothetical protein
MTDETIIYSRVGANFNLSLYAIRILEQLLCASPLNFARY